MDDKNHWITSVLDNTSNHKKLFLDICGITSNERFLQQHLNLGITHLTIIMHTNNTCTQLALPDLHNLKQLAIGNYSIFPFNSFKELIRNNPGLESLSIGEKCTYCCNSKITYPFDEVMELIGTYLTQLKEFSYVHDGVWRLFEATSDVSDHVIDGFVNSLKHLESLTLSVIDYLYVDFVELLQRLASGCKNIKHLALFEIPDDFRLIEAVQSFENIERLELQISYDSLDVIESLVEHLPFLCDLQIVSLEANFHTSFLLSLLRKCPSLENITVDTYHLEEFRTQQFFDEFIKTMQKPNVKIQIGSITKNELIWQNEVVHSVGHDPIQNSSNVNLLELAEQRISKSNC